jgi:hypothetical protein
MKNSNEHFYKKTTLVIMLIMCMNIKSLEAQNRLTQTIADRLGVVFPPSTTEQLIWSAYFVSWAETHPMPKGGTFLPYLDLPYQLVDDQILNTLDMVKTMYDLVAIVANQGGKTPFEFITYMGNRIKPQQRDRFYFRLHEWGKMSGLIPRMETEDYSLETFLSELKWSEDQWKN